ncbi:MAG: hypothetical protein K2N58_05560 [Treponemataceae bacterium]|nr:hypothetical protein [Treponemataceae bacterium]
MQTNKTISFKYKAILIMLAAALLASCENLISRTPRETMGGGYGEVGNSESGSLTVTARISNGSSRYAMPSMPEFIYAALLYKNDKSTANENFVQGTSTENAGETKLNFSFQKPENTNGTFTLEIFAFEKTSDENTLQFSKETALLSGKKDGLSINGDTIEIDGTIALAISSTEPGTVSLKIKVPEGCSLEIDDACFIVTGTSLDFIITQVGDGIAAGAYQLKFTVKKGDEIVHIFSEYINVINGFCTDTWGGSEKGTAKEISQSMISSTVYVRGTGGWYDKPEHYKDTATASDSNSGSFLSPLATIQKAVDAIIARNDGASAYTIYVDGTFTATSSAALANFNGVSQALSVKVASLSASESEKTVLNGNSTVGCVMVGSAGKKDLNLTLENLVITDGNFAGNGGGIFFNGKRLEMTGCEVIGCEAKNGGGVYVNSGTFTAEKCAFSGNIAKEDGGAIYINTNAEATMTDIEIKGNEASLAGGTCVSGGMLEMKNCEIEGNIATSYYGGGIRVYNGGTVIMDGGTISGNRVEGSYSDRNYGGGVYVASSTSAFTMKGDVTISGNILSDTVSKRYGSGVYMNSGTFTMNGGEIKENKAINGGGVYINGGSFTMDGGMISDNTASSSGGGVYGNGGAFKMTGGTISSNTALSGGGVCVYYGTFTMSGGELTSNLASSSFGGGIYISENGTFTMEKGSINGCRAVAGGGVYNAGKLTVLSGTKISGCAGNVWGGGIYNHGDSAVAEISGCTIESCKTTSNSGNAGGGGICNTAGTLTVSNCTFTLCTTAASGGGILNTRILTVSNTSFTDCSADAKGGGIRNANGTVTPTNITYSGCTASTDNNGSGF